MVGEGKAVFHDFLGMSFLSSESWGATATARHEEASRSTGVVDGIDHGSFSAGSRLLSGHLGLAVAAAAPCSSDPGSERMSCGKWEGIHGGMGALGSNRSVTGEKKRETSTSSLRESLQDTSESSGGIKILEQCQGKKKCSVNSSPFQELKNFLCEKKQSSAKKMMLLIIDEMDYLISKDQAVLYDLFRLPTFPNSHCMLIGISNAIDLTDRFLPKLQSLNCKPLVMTFRTYSKEQILKILQQRLMDLPCQIFQLEALELCARKVAAASGDMRKALHVCRGAVEMLEAELTSGIHELDDIPHEKSMTNGLNLPPERLTKQEINVVRIDHMARALAKTFRSAVVDTIQTLPRHQQIVLCSAVKFFRRRKKDATLGELNVAYLDFCKTTSMYPLTGPEFSSMCRVLSDQALLNLGQSREDRLRRVTLRVDEGDVNFALQGIRFFRNCLQ